MSCQNSSNLRFSEQVSEINVIISQFNRLMLLENAVVNYAGGLEQIKNRITFALSQIDKDKQYPISDFNIQIELLLKDIMIYLRDISNHLDT